MSCGTPCVEGALRFASLGSGSEGNALAVCGSGAQGRDPVSGRPRVLLIDCGFGWRETQRRLTRLGLEASDVVGILVTHEHSDHVGGVFRLARQVSSPIFITPGTLRACAPPEACTPLIRLIDAHAPFECQGWRIEPFPVPHDALEPVQYVIDDGRVRLGVITDLGHPTPHLPKALSKLNALVLETNHDARLLAASHYPPSLQARISGRYGHLENQDAAFLLASLDRSQLEVVVAAHLSRHNNRPELAQAALGRAIGWHPEAIRVADQDEGLAWVEI